jgi:hypothetical protein
MKKICLLLLIITLATNVFSQKEFRIYSTIKSKIIPFVDSIFNLSFERTHRDNILNYKEMPYTIETLRVFGKNILLVDSPDSSKVVRKLALGEIVYCPYYFNTNDSYYNIWHLGWLYKLDDIGDGMGATTWFRLVFLEDGTFGFINEFDLFNNISTLPATDLLFIKEHQKKAIVKNDFSRAFYFNSYYYPFSKDGKFMTYSWKGEKFPQPDSAFVYLYELSTWKNKKIGYGYSPIFLNNQIVYWSGFRDDSNPEKVHLYDIASGYDKVIYQVPDSITLWWCGEDGCDPRDLKIESSGNKIRIILGLSYINDYESVKWFTFKINLKGEIIEIRENKQFETTD